MHDNQKYHECSDHLPLLAAQLYCRLCGNRNNGSIESVTVLKDVEITPLTLMFLLPKILLLPKKKDPVKNTNSHETQEFQGHQDWRTELNRQRIKLNSMLPPCLLSAGSSLPVPPAYLNHVHWMLSVFIAGYLEQDLSMSALSVSST